MAKRQPSDVDTWLGRETGHTRKALENASSYFDNKDVLTVNTLEAIYGQESSFGINRRTRGMNGAAGDFHLEKKTAERYGLVVSKKNDQRFDIDYASIAAARYLKDLDRIFGKRSVLSEGRTTSPVRDVLERKKFVLAAYNDGEGQIARAQYLAQEAGKDPANWNDVQQFLEQAGNTSAKAGETRQYVDGVPKNETEFADKSLADKKAKDKKIGKSKGLCVNGHWITKDHHHIFICD